MSATIHLREQPDQRSAAVDVVGDLDAGGGKAVREGLAALVEAGRVDLTINLDRVGMLDSSGLAALISSLRIARAKGGDVRVETTNAAIRRVLEVTALSRVFKLAPAAGIAA